MGKAKTKATDSEGKAKKKSKAELPNAFHFPMNPDVAF